MPPQVSSQAPIWVFPEKAPSLFQAITKEFNIHPVIAQILISRGFKTIEEIHEFLYGKLPNLLDPDLFPDMEVAVDRVLQALRHREPILIYGDNDVDGMTAAAVALSTTFAFRGNVETVSANRAHSVRRLLC